MSESIAVTFTADIADLQRGLREAAGGIAETTSACRASAEQVATSFADISRAYAAGVAQRMDQVRAESRDELAVARAGERAQTDIALDAVKVKQIEVQQAARLTQLSHDEERAQLLALEAERVAIEQRHLAFLQSTYQGNAAAYANAQRQIDELSAQSAVRRAQIERQYASQVYNDYRATFEQVGASLSQQVTGLISDQQSLRQAVASVLLSIIGSFVAARARIVADWAAGVVAQTAATSAGEAAKTGAVVAGAAVRTTAEQTAATASGAATLIAISKSIIASAAETFAGIFGFLSPVLGPAAAGPAVAGQATVLAVGASLPSFDAGAWSLPADMFARVHRGEMIVPAGPAAQIRSAASGGAGTVHVHHQTHLNVTAMDSRDVKRFLSGHSRAILAAISEGVHSGSHLGLRRLGRA